MSVAFFLFLAAIGSEDRPRNQVTKLVSGDDLEDDFMDDDFSNADKDKSSKSKDVNEKPKKKKGPTVVNFT